jgi:nitronate monooxygenase
MNARERARAFCDRFGLGLPILEAPMAGACPPARAAAVAAAGGMAGFGGVLSSADAIAAWFAAFRAAGGGPAQANLWVPDAAPARDPSTEARVRGGLAHWGPPPAADAGETRPPDFAAQCEAVLAARPAVASSIMGLFPPAFVATCKHAGIAWFATVTTIAEAEAAAAAGADAIVAQGIEAGGHRGAFDPEGAETRAVGLFALLPVLADRIAVPIVAAGGIADGRGIAAALTLGASAVQIGTALLAADEADTHPAWRAAIAATPPDGTRLTRAYSGRPARAIANAYVRAEPASAPYPVQRALTAVMRADALATGDAARMQMWAGQSAALARPAPAADLLQAWWRDADAMLA